MTEYKFYHEEVRPGQTIDIPEDAICIQTFDFTVDLDDRWYCNLAYLKPINKTDTRK